MELLWRLHGGVLPEKPATARKKPEELQKWLHLSLDEARQGWSGISLR